jgi:hypothetical protein
MARFAFGVPLILLLASVASTQTPPPSDPKAVAFATQSIAALTNGTATADVTLSGNAIWTTGTNTESGTATATARQTWKVGSTRHSVAGTAGSYATVPEAAPKVRGSTPADNHRPVPHTTAGRVPSMHAITCIPRSCSGHLLEVGGL